MWLYLLMFVRKMFFEQEMTCANIIMLIPVWTVIFRCWRSSSVSTFVFVISSHLHMHSHRLLTVGQGHDTGCDVFFINSRTASLAFRHTTALQCYLAHRNWSSIIKIVVPSEVVACCTVLRTWTILGLGRGIGASTGGSLWHVHD